MEELLEAVFSVEKFSRSAVCSESDYKAGVRWSPACEDVSPGAEERPLLEAVTKQGDWKHWSVFISVL
jgi:hypothetical protein